MDLPEVGSMTRSPARAWIPPLLVLAASVGCAIGALLFRVDPEEGIAESLALYICFISFGVVGTLVVAKGGSRVLGWIFVMTGFLWTSGDFAIGLGTELYSRPDPGPIAPLTAWYVEWYWIPLILGQLAVTPIVFPSGRPMNERWQKVLTAILSGVALFTIAAAVDPELDIDGEIVGNNTIGFSPFGDLEDGILAAFFFPFMFVSALTGAIALVQRFRRSRGEERQQMKWVVFTGVAFVAVFFSLVVIDVLGFTRPVFLDAAMSALLPIGLGIAILRYRLYDIDVIINRTLVYGSLTALLVLAYLGLVFALQELLEPFTRESDLAVAASTLAVAALVRPLSLRLQRFIDRRFYRRKYDARRTLEGLTHRLRDEVEISTVASDVLGAVRETVQPAHISLWLRTEP
jgi:hypothetical protein